MLFRRYAGVAVTFSVGACGVSAGGLSPDDGITPVTSDAQPQPITDPQVDAAKPAPIHDAAVADAATMSPSQCQIGGTYALNLAANVHWAGTTLFDIVPIIVSGDGPLSVQTLIQVADTPDHTVTVRACGVALPEFQSILTEVYVASIPDQVWEALSLRWTTRLKLACEEPGCAFRADPVVAQLGIDIPPQQAWPTSRDSIPEANKRDDDGDGVVGVRVDMRGPAFGTRYQYPPTSVLLRDRVMEIGMGIRLGATLDGTFETCDAPSGEISGMTLDIRSLACHLQSGAPCSEEDRSFIDDNTPVWKVQSARFQAQRMPANATCADVRKKLAMIASP